jgi:AcrR family transcriptional regulator
MPRTAAPSRPYHHGDLPNAVKQAALAVLATEGPAALSLRQVAAQAGVSHTAPRHHFGDKKQLLTVLAVDGFDALAAALSQVLDTVDAPTDRLPALLSAYAAHHLSHPGYAAIMWRTDLLDTTDPGLQRASLRTFQILHDAAATVDAPLADALGPYRFALMLWSLAHGVTALADRLTPALADAIGDPDPDLPPPEQLLAQFTHAALQSAR